MQLSLRVTTTVFYVINLHIRHHPPNFYAAFIFLSLDPNPDWIISLFSLDNHGQLGLK